MEPHPHPDEELDIVNDYDEVIGQASRQEIHDKKLPHRAVHLFVVGSDRKMLLQKRSEKKPTWPGAWDSAVSGHVTAGQTYREAIDREQQEEIGVTTPLPLVPLMHVGGNDALEMEWVTLYISALLRLPALQPDPEEISEMRWWNLDELTDRILMYPDEFAQGFRTLFFLWREANFLVPEKMFGDWYTVFSAEETRLSVARGLFESAGIPTRLFNMPDISGVPGKGFFSSKDPYKGDLAVPMEHITEAVDLLYLSRPEEGWADVSDEN